MAPRRHTFTVPGLARSFFDFSAGLAPVFTDHPGYLSTLEGYREIVVLDGQQGGRANAESSKLETSFGQPAVFNVDLEAVRW